MEIGRGVCKIISPSFLYFSPPAIFLPQRANSTSPATAKFLTSNQKLLLSYPRPPLLVLSSTPSPIHLAASTRLPSTHLPSIPPTQVSYTISETVRWLAAPFCLMYNGNRLLIISSSFNLSVSFIRTDPPTGLNHHALCPAYLEQKPDPQKPEHHHSRYSITRSLFLHR